MANESRLLDAADDLQVVEVGLEVGVLPGRIPGVPNDIFWSFAAAMQSSLTP